MKVRDALIQVELELIKRDHERHSKIENIPPIILQHDKEAIERLERGEWLYTPDEHGMYTLPEGYPTNDLLEAEITSWTVIEIPIEGTQAVRYEVDFDNGMRYHQGWGYYCRNPWVEHKDNPRDVEKELQEMLDKYPE